MSASGAAISAPAALPRRRLRPPKALIIGALSIVVAVVGAYVGSNAWASIRQRGIERRFDAAAQHWATLDPVARSNLTYAPGDPIARLEISRIGLDTIVVQGATAQIMRSAPGHLPASATPGENGVAIVTANRIGFGSFFLRIDRLQVGDTIVASSAIGRTVFQVESVRVVPSDQMDLSVESTTRVLMLFASNGLWGGADRIVVRAVAAEAGSA